jgi:hypothetical protein
VTYRALILGFFGVVLLCGATYFNDYLLQQTPLIGNHLPISIYGGLLLFLLLINPLLARMGSRMPLQGKELVVILALCLAAATVPSSGLLRTMTNLLMLPHHLTKSEPGWNRQGLIELLPDQILADPGEGDNALNSFIQGLGRGGQNIGLGDIPWEAWTTTLSFWVPMILFIYLAMLGLALVVHRQWSDHEQLPYPLVKFADALLPDQPGKALGAVFQNRLFWLGAGLVGAIQISRFAYVWFPGWVEIPLTFSFTSLFSGAPAIQAEGVQAFNFRVYFSMIAIAYFLAADVGLAIGLAPMIYPFIAAFFTSQGISLKGGGSQAPERFVVAGAFFGIFATILYTGRHYFLATFRRALGLGGAPVPLDSLWGARLFLTAMVCFIGGLVFVGMELWVASALAFVFVIFYLVLGRIIAETGLFFIQPWWVPSALFLGLLGGNALTPETIILLFFVSAIFMIDPREAVMPFLINALKLVDIRKVPVGKSAVGLGAALVLALAVALPVTLYHQYNKGTRMGDSWAANHVPKMPFNETLKVVQRLDAQGALESASTPSFQNISPNPTLLTAFIVGLGLTAFLSIGRLRFVKWPIHPICMIVFCSYAGYMVAFSFLIGWAIKSFVTKYGGETGFHAVKPLMFGLIAGDLIGGIIPIIVGWIYYFSTGELPKPFSIFPG